MNMANLWCCHPHSFLLIFMHTAYVTCAHVNTQQHHLQVQCSFEFILIAWQWLGGGNATGEAGGKHAAGHL